jgi:signal transduction histidine kinase/DNA-binding response OmpR family regulator/HAMP domain-containing protein
MKIKNVRVRTKLQIGLGAILLFVIALSALAWIHTDNLWEEVQGIYDHPLTVIKSVGNIKADILTIHRDMKDLLLAKNDQEIQTILQDMKIHETDVYRQFDILYDRYLGKRTDIDEAYQSFAQWTAIREETIRLLRAGKTDEAVNRTKPSGVGGGHAIKLLGHVRDLSAFAGGKADEYYTYAARHNDSQKRQLTIIVGLIILLTSGIGYFLLTEVRKPVEELSTAAEKFQKGDLYARSGYMSDNEFGKLSASFNGMAESVAFQMELKDINEKISDVILSANDLSSFRKNLLKSLFDVTDSQMGAYFLLNRTNNLFEPVASIGVDHERLLPFDASTLEGELGKVLTTRKMAHLKDIPKNALFNFRTFTGTISPKEIISFPIVIDDAVMGVVSIASIKPYSARAVAVMNQPWASLVSTAFDNLIANDKTKQLAGELRESNQELQAQQEELEAQAEELRKQSEELQAQNVELERQRVALEEASRMKSQFLSNMSHELRTPLNSVLALSRVIMMQAKTKLTEEEINYLEIIERNGKNLLTLINEILDLSKIEAGRMDVNPKPFSLRLTLENIVESIGPLAAEKHIKIRMGIPDDLPLLESDEIRVSQILQNIVANAVKFTDAGSVTVSAESSSGMVSVRIDDTGIGIAEEDLPHIFDEFRQVDGSSARRHEGTGLGLAIARKAARMLGGNITVQSAPGKGSTFVLALPVAWGGKAPLYESAATGKPSGLQSMAKYDIEDSIPSTVPPRILLVEDNEAAIIQIKYVLESAGYIIDVARGGRDAIAFVSHTIPDGIVLDLMMPEIDGFEVLEKIRGTDKTEKIPVLILTAKDLTQKDLMRLSSNNIQQLVQKGDVDRESLLSKIRAMIGGREKLEAGNLKFEPRNLKADAGKRPSLSDASRPATILVVEDNPDNMTTIKAILQNRYRIREATDGEKGLMMAAETGPDLILLDMALPGMDGLTVVRRLKDDEALGRIPVIALTAQVMKGDRERILEAGCDDYVSKPIDPEGFLKKIGKWLKK